MGSGWGPDGVRMGSGWGSGWCPDGQLWMMQSWWHGCNFVTPNFAQLVHNFDDRVAKFANSWSQLMIDDDQSLHDRSSELIDECVLQSLVTQSCDQSLEVAKLDHQNFLWTQIDWCTCSNGTAERSTWWHHDHDDHDHNSRTHLRKFADDHDDQQLVIDPKLIEVFANFEHDANYFFDWWVRSCWSTTCKKIIDDNIDRIKVVDRSPNFVIEKKLIECITTFGWWWHKKFLDECCKVCWSWSRVDDAQQFFWSWWHTRSWVRSWSVGVGWARKQLWMINHQSCTIFPNSARKFPLI